MTRVPVPDEGLLRAERPVPMPEEGRIEIELLLRAGRPWHGERVVLHPPLARQLTSGRGVSWQLLV